jgi:hypothetical protein
MSFGLLLLTLGNSSKVSKKPPLLMLILSMVWFSPVQVENWLWGSQLAWFLSVFGVMLVSYGLSKISEKKIFDKYTLILVTGAVIAQYSLGNGSLVWPLLMAALFYKKTPNKKVLFVAAAGIISIVLYYAHYVTPPGAPSRGLALHQPFEYAKFVFLYLGRPLSYMHTSAMIAGLLLIIIFSGLCVYLFLREKTKFNSSIPWIFLGLYSIASGMVTGLARLGFGVYGASASRYTTISSLLLISTIILFWQNKAVFKKMLPGKFFKIVYQGVTLILLVCISANIYWGGTLISHATQSLNIYKPMYSTA